MKLKFKSIFIVIIAALCAFRADEQTIRILMIGDSTMSIKPIEKQFPERGWGQALPSSFDQNVNVMDFAVNGRSTKSFRSEGRWDKVLQQARKGDWLVIQFGHNDEKLADTTRGATPEQYAENLKGYVREARAKGIKPILATPIVRRQFNEKGVLENTHSTYPDKVREVARQMNVPLIDMTLLTEQLVNGYGPEESKQLFKWVAKGVNPAVPEGIEDNTHLSERGARQVARLGAKAMCDIIPDISKHYVDYDFVVAQDGTGDFMTVQQAINAVPNFSTRPTTIYIKDGTYREKIIVPSSKQGVTMTGQSADKTILVYNDYAQKQSATGVNIGTSGSATMYIFADNFTLKNLTVANDAGPVGQAVALMVCADMVTVEDCRLLGYQDTLYTKAPATRQYYKNCFIEGTTDFIFGWAQAFFENCTLNSKVNSYVTAASTPEEQQLGYVFLNCRLTADSGVDKVYLGRPWRPFAKTVFIDCELGGHIVPAGWHNWAKPDAEKTSYYGEYNSRGAGANPSSRVAWSHQLTKSEADKILSEVWRGQKTIEQK